MLSGASQQTAKAGTLPPVATVPAVQISASEFAKTELDLQAEATCPACNQGRMIILGKLDLLNPTYSPPTSPVSTADTS